MAMFILHFLATERAGWQRWPCETGIPRKEEGGVCMCVHVCKREGERAYSLLPPSPLPVLALLQPLPLHTPPLLPKKKKERGRVALWQ